MLTIDQIAPLMRCPTCGKAGLAVADGGIACPEGHVVAVKGNSIRIEGAQDNLSDEWQAQQDVALPEYHEGTAEGPEALGRLFGGFMSVSLRPHHKVLDVGCGIGSDLPPYVRELGLDAYLGLEPLVSPNAPSFPVFSGAIAEKIPLKDGALDAVMYATSMDHIEDIDGAISEAKRVTGPDGRLYMWIGIYDPDTIAQAKTFDVIMRGSRLKKTLRFLGAHVEYAHTLWKMRDRKRRLDNDIRIDPYHCRYYTRERVKAALAHWQLKEIRSLVVPGTGSMFVEAVPA